uniref:Uncharacterized protein n=1 Tax=Heterorhabditis bacteriophora TaxID=37862 RepID=A0A1I7WIP0_HETBA
MICLPLLSYFHDPILQKLMYNSCYRSLFDSITSSTTMVFIRLLFIFLYLYAQVTSNENSNTVPFGELLSTYYVEHQFNIEVTEETTAQKIFEQLLASSTSAPSEETTAQKIFEQLLASSTSAPSGKILDSNLYKCRVL